ncbi:hypothetical protein PL715_01450 [Bifidobacterium breve]|nr:hypothetical protein [Bifidobacterium breve]MCZ4384733.1 hypothetical protein [Bifidobacterium breve]MCZ4401417.1 hypothetical protein [Bifidobacterium breve]MCZ4426533.1 hypothetical protein [Bifidobacterium breve]MCZ4433717.1 hypothetical protein [Bifidobacterium breve]MCZ4439468.1 hypothetical protein [Bifidobacterium breve]
MTSSNIKSGLTVGNIYRTQSVHAGNGMESFVSNTKLSISPMA